ncbi:MAG: hypothetical protein LBE16_06300 [Clostridiales Family XIII bacterium]|jgi:hypothetical protein|nr:hypothetical protein [Clostridiales Family XIII bacterium]
MRKHTRTAAAVLTSALLILAGPLAAFAANENAADFDREAGAGNEWSYVGVRTYGSLNDLFGEMTKELAPGAERTVKVQLRNRSDAETIFRLRAEVLTKGKAEVLEEDFAGKTATDALLSRISVTVTYGGAPLYTGTLGGVGAGDLYAANGAALGTLAANRHGEIEVKLTVPEDLGNEYFNSLCAVNWIFIATQADAGDIGDSDDPVGPVTVIPDGATPLDDGPLTEIEDEDTPLVTLTGDPEDPEVVIIADPETPLSLPQTGGLMTYATPAALALAVLIALYIAIGAKSRKKANKAA